MYRKQMPTLLAILQVSASSSGSEGGLTQQYKSLCVCVQLCILQLLIYSHTSAVRGTLSVFIACVQGNSCDLEVV